MVRPAVLGGFVKSPFKTVVHALSWVGEKIALVVTPILLTVFYVLVIGVANVVTRLTGADMLRRKGIGNPTFWFEKPQEPKTKDRYLAQF